MEMAPQPILTGNRASVSDAKAAYFEGDFERCLEICTAIRVSSIATASEVALLSARAYLRTGRPREAEVAVVDSLATYATLDAALTAQMLVASARIRQDDADTGIAILLEAASRADDAHLAVRSEIAFCLGLAYWAKREIDTAERYLAQVDPRSDIIHARALELQAWCFTARRDFGRSANAFRETLLRLDTCRARDRAIEATALSTLSIFAAELFDHELAHFVGIRAQSMDWTSGLQIHHYMVLLTQALYHEFAGDTLAAFHFAALARESAPTVPFEILGWSTSSVVARNAGETFSAITFARRAQHMLETLDMAELAGEERLSLLSVAENCAHFDVEKATEFFTRYWRLEPVDAMIAASGDPRLTAEEAFIAGRIAGAQGQRDRAVSCYRKAFEIFSGIGYRRRAIIAGQALLTFGLDSGVRCYLDTHLTGTSNFITRSLIEDDDQLRSLDHHPVVAALPKRQRDVVALVCLGKTNKEIAQLRNVGEQTIKNMLTKHIFRAFGVSSRSALVSSCLRGRAAGE